MHELEVTRQEAIVPAEQVSNDMDLKMLFIVVVASGVLYYALFTTTFLLPTHQAHPLQLVLLRLLGAYQCIGHSRRKAKNAAIVAESGVSPVRSFYLLPLPFITLSNVRRAITLQRYALWFVIFGLFTRVSLFIAAASTTFLFAVKRSYSSKFGHMHAHLPLFLLLLASMKSPGRCLSIDALMGFSLQHFSLQHFSLQSKTTSVKDKVLQQLCLDTVSYAQNAPMAAVEMRMMHVVLSLLYFFPGIHKFCSLWSENGSFYIHFVQIVRHTQRKNVPVLPPGGASDMSVVCSKMLTDWLQRYRGLSGLLAAITIMFEVGILFASPWQYSRTLFGCVAVIFHLSVWVVLCIDFRPLAMCVVCSMLLDVHWFIAYDDDATDVNVDVDVMVSPSVVQMNVLLSCMFSGIVCGQVYMGVHKKEVGIPFCCYPTFAPWNIRGKRKMRSD